MYIVICSFNFYVCIEVKYMYYIMQNAGLDEAQAGIKIVEIHQ